MTMKQRTEEILERLYKPLIWVLTAVVLLNGVTYGYQLVTASPGKSSGTGFSQNSGVKTRQPVNVASGKLLAYYPLDGNANDGAQTGRTNLAFAGLTNSAAGKHGRGISMNAGAPSNGVVRDPNVATCGSSCTLLDMGNKSFTFATWAYLTGTSAYPTLFSKWDDDSDPNRQIYVYYDAGNINLNLRITNGGSYSTLIASTAFSTSTWNFILVSYDASTRTASISVNNGTAAESVASSGYYVAAAGSASFEIGNSYGQNYPWKGIIDSFGVWERVLSATEKAELYNSSGSGASGRNFSSLTPALKENIKAWYDFEQTINTSGGTINDSVTQPNNSGTVNGATLTNSGVFGQAYSFDGNDHITTASDLNLSSNAVSFSGWFKLNSGAGSYCNTLISKGSGNSASTTDYIFQYGYDGTSSCGQPYASFFIAGDWFRFSKSLTTGLWYHYAATYNGATVKAYINGTELTCSTSPDCDDTDAIYNGTGIVRIGRQGDTCDCNYFRGVLDDLRIYDVALTADEVAKLYGGSSSPLCDQSCVGWWKNDEQTLTSGVTNSVAGAPSYDHTLTDNATVGQTTGKVGNAALFEQDNSEYLSHIDTDTLTPDGNFTIAAWVYLDSKPTAGYPDGYMHVVTKAGAAGSYEYSLSYSAANNQHFTFVVYNDGMNYWVNESTVAVSTGTWYYLVARADFSADTTWLTVNGTTTTLSGINGGESVYQSGAADFRIGHGFAGNSPTLVPGYWDGRIDEVGMWDRKLSDTEVTSLYNSGNGKSLVSLSSTERSSLISWWDMEETSGSRYDSRFRTLTTGLTAADGVYKGGFSFDGSGDYAVAPDSSQLDITRPFTISFWFKPANLTDTNDYIISKLNDAGTDNVYGVIWGYVAGNVSLYVAGASGSPPAHTDIDITIPDTGWHHIAYTYTGTSGSGTVTGYLDGKSVVSGTWTFALAASTGALYFGSFNGTSNQMNASLDDVRIQNRALANYEIYEQYLAGKSN